MAQSNYYLCDAESHVYIIGYIIVYHHDELVQPALDNYAEVVKYF